MAEKEKELKEMQENLKRQEEERLMKVREMELKLQQQQVIFFLSFKKCQCL